MAVTPEQGLLSGQVLQNRYRVVSLLGEGGMGAVYRAWDLRLEKHVAIKEMVPQPGLDTAKLAQFRTQFRQEAVILGGLEHPNLVLVTDYFEEESNDYLVMAFVDGETLADRIQREGALPEAPVAVWAEQLLDALAYCHAKGVIHRDIKPQNVVITPQGKAVLVDFGLVKLWDPADPRTKTVMRGVGTPEYAPPEQWGVQGHHTDPRSDLYSLGATLYHALTGQAPPTASDRMVYPKEYQTPRELNDRVSPQMDAAITRAMTLAIDERWPDATSMARGLAAGPEPRNAAVSRSQPAATRRLPEASRPRPAGIPLWGWGLGGIALVVGLALGLRNMGGSGVTESPTASSEVRPTVTVVIAEPATLLPAATETREPTAAPVAILALPGQPFEEHVVQAGDTLAGIAVLYGVDLEELLRLNQINDSTIISIGDVLRIPGPQGRYVRAADGMTMVYVPSGSFAMGSNDGPISEAPVHEVTLDAFWLDRTEVTNEQYAAFLNVEGNQTEGGVTWLHIQSDDALVALSGETYRPKSGYADHPVVMVSWYGARAYCAWAGGRLPTEAEWEYAAGGPMSRIFPWGNAPQQGYANCTETQCGDGFDRMAPVGSFSKGTSWVEALDMAGNVWEWIEDWYQSNYYSISPDANPPGPENSPSRAVRSGSWESDWGDLRVAFRNYDAPTERRSVTGFRCAGDAPGN